MAALSTVETFCHLIWRPCWGCTTLSIAHDLERAGHSVKSTAGSRALDRQKQRKRLLDGRPRHDDQPVLALPVGHQIDVARLIGHRHRTGLGEGSVDALGFAKDQAR